MTIKGVDNAAKIKQLDVLMAEENTIGDRQEKITLLTNLDTKGNYNL